MTVLKLQPWTPGLNKVALTKLLHSRAHISLSLAKRYVDELLDGREVVLPVRSLRAANELVREVGAIGTVAFIDEQPDSQVLWLRGQLHQPPQTLPNR